MAASALVLIIPSDRPSRVAGLGGTYRAQTQRGPHGQPIYYNSRKGLFLFATSDSDLAISTRVGTAVHRARRAGPVTSSSGEPQEWMVLQRGRWKSEPLTCRELDAADQPDEPAEAIVVSATRWDAVAGLYERKQAASAGAASLTSAGALPTYVNAEDGCYMWQHKGSWHISKEATPSAEAAEAALASGSGGAASPEEAEWTGGLVVRGVDYHGGRQSDLDGDPALDEGVRVAPSAASATSGPPFSFARRAL